MIKTIYLKKTPFLNIQNHLKTIEVRQDKNFIKTLKENEKVYIQNKDTRILITIKKIVRFNNLLELLNNTSLNLINPNLKTIQDSLIYFQTYYNNFKTPFTAIYFIV